MLKKIWGSDKRIRYILIGGINTSVGLSVYPILYLILDSVLTYFQILILSQAICIGFAYLSTKKMVFKTKGNWGGEISKFLTFHAIVLVTNILTLPLLVDAVGLSPIIGQTLFSVIVMILSYVWHSRITFRKS